jgi:hypothetical protein
MRAVPKERLFVIEGSGGRRDARHRGEFFGEEVLAVTEIKQKTK